MQKARRRTGPRERGHSASTVCRHTVSGTISLPLQGCFSPFPHGTGSLSVVGEYLALEGGPPRFGQDYSCPDLLRNRPSGIALSLTGLSPSMARLSCTLQLTLTLHVGRPTTPHTPKGERFGLIPVRSPLLGESLLIYLPRATEMFHFARFAPAAYVFSGG